MKNNYSKISVPTELISEVEKLIEKQPELGYKSKAEFTKEAIRKLLAENRPKIEVASNVS